MLHATRTRWATMEAKSTFFSDAQPTPKRRSQTDLGPLLESQSSARSAPKPLPQIHCFFRWFFTGFGLRFSWIFHDCLNDFQLGFFHPFFNTVFKGFAKSPRCPEPSLLQYFPYEIKVFQNRPRHIFKVTFAHILLKNHSKIQQKSINFWLKKRARK